VALASYRPAGAGARRTLRCGVIKTEVTSELMKLHTIGFDGLVLNYLGELPSFAQEVLPRLERAVVR